MHGTAQGATRICHVRLDRADELPRPVLRVLLSEVPNVARDIAVVNLGLHYDFRARCRCLHSNAVKPVASHCMPEFVHLSLGQARNHKNANQACTQKW
jgi:hypothetical protein